MEFKILDMIQEIRTPILDSLMCMITKLGNAGAIWIILAGIVVGILAGYLGYQVVVKLKVIIDNRRKRILNLKKQS